MGDEARGGVHGAIRGAVAERGVCWHGEAFGVQIDFVQSKP